jgi:hypothetical protein
VPTSQLAPIEGDPQAVAAAGRTLDSIAAEVAIASKILRALATGTDEWTGHAASQAKLRSATLPPKLDKVERSYATAGGALRTYATALVETQQRSAAAIRAHIAANADLAAARAAKQSAAEADAAQAKAAAAAAVPAPPPTAVRYDADISDAEARAARAVQANADAHDDLTRAAHSAASSLHDASREGIKNKPWWRRVLTSTAHWASVAWHDGLRLVSRVATAVSALAGLAALTLALAGIAFPPLEAAAAILESISVVSGVVGMAADTAMAATGDGSWTTVAGDALMFAPAVGAAALRRAAPVLRRIAPSRLTSGTPARGLRLRLVDYADSWPRPPRSASDPRAVAALQTRSGKVFLGRSRFAGTPNARVESALNDVPTHMREPYHGHCAEIDCITQALNDGVRVNGSLVVTARVRGPHSVGHGQPIEPCTSCSHVLAKLGVKYSGG